MLPLLMLLSSATVLVEGKGGRVRVVVELAPGTDPTEFGAENGLAWIGMVAGGLVGNHHEYEYGDASNAAVTESLERSKRDGDARMVGYSVQEPHTRSPRHDYWDEELLPQRIGGSDLSIRASSRQWHMSDIDNGAAAHLGGAWGRGFHGLGVGITVVDDGLDVDHPDIAPGYRAEGSANLNGDAGSRDDPSPRGDEAHGTAAGSVAAAAGSEPPICGKGVASKATLAGVRLIASAPTDADEANALTSALRRSDVYSCSWGPPDTGATLDGPGPLTAAAISRGARVGGRNGEGSVYVWAGGNGAARRDSCAYDGYASHPDVMAVGALDYRGLPASYSEPCPALMASAPSSGSGRSIYAADVAGRRGASPGDCRSDFGGTSAAAPFFAGVVALMLEANPRLDPRDVARIVVASSRRIGRDAVGGDWVRNGAGVWHSDRYGFGAVDAEMAVLVASDYNETEYVDASWSSESATVWHPAQVVGGVIGLVGEGGIFPAQIPDNPPGGRSAVVSCISMEHERDGDSVERASAVVTMHHSRRGDITFYLISPSGTISRFDNRPGDSGRSYDSWPLWTVANWDEDPSGEWCLAVMDVVPGNTGYLDSWSLELRGRRLAEARTISGV